MGNYDPISKILWTLAGSGKGGTITTSGDSTTGAGPGPALDGHDVTDLALIVVVTGTPTGTSPTLMVQVDMQDANGNWIPGVVKLAANITAAGTYVVYGGLNGGPGSAYVVLTGKLRVSWTIGGTASPTFTGVQIALQGR
jgi:hypothetical protein